MTRARRVVGRVVGVQALGPKLGRVDIDGPGIGVGVEAGQFAMVEAPGRLDCVLLRPYSYFLAERDRVAFLLRAVGKGTAALLGAPPGTPVAVLGPLGHPFPLPDGECWMVAGGVGAAAFGLLATHRPGRVLFGARGGADVGFAKALEARGALVDVATEDASVGFPGRVTDLLQQRLAGARPTSLLACGPTPMLAAVAEVGRRVGIPTWVSLEERMGCGIGVCRGCAHRDAVGGWRCICVDGPVYPADVIFASAAPRAAHD